MKLLKFDFKNYHSLLKKNPQTSSKLLSSPHFALSKKTNCRNFELNYFLSLSYTHESPCNDTKSNHLAWIIMIASAVTGETKDHHHIFYFLKHNEQFCKHFFRFSHNSELYLGFFLAYHFCASRVTILHNLAKRRFEKGSGEVWTCTLCVGMKGKTLKTFEFKYLALKMPLN